VAAGSTLETAAPSPAPATPPPSAVAPETGDTRIARARIRGGRIRVVDEMMTRR